ncbi:MAG: DUF1828 domain-containing protein [Blastocatellia bacterium]
MSAISITIKDKRFVVGSNIVRDCNKLKTGVIRLETSFQYPDRSYVDLFLLEETLLEQPFINSANINKTKLILTDLGNTTNSLLDSHIELWATQQARKMVKLVCDSLAVDYENGEFRVFIDEQGGNDLTEYVLRLAQACIRACYINVV